MDPDLQAGVVALVEELREFIVGEVRGAVVLRVRVRLQEGRRPSADRPVGREVAADRREAEIDDARDVGGRDEHGGVHGEPVSVPQEDLEVLITFLPRHRHLMDTRDPASCRERTGSKLELFDAVRPPRGGDPPADSLVRRSRHPPGGLTLRVPFAAIEVEGLRERERSRVRQAEVTVGPPDDERPIARRVELSQGGKGRCVPRRLVVPLEEHDGVRSTAARPRASASSSSFERAATTSRFREESPVPVRWTWLSTKPGRTVVPGRSTVRSAAGGSPLPTR